MENIKKKPINSLTGSRFMQLWKIICGLNYCQYWFLPWAWPKENWRPAFLLLTVNLRFSKKTVVLSWWYRTQIKAIGPAVLKHIFVF